MNDNELRQALMTLEQVEPPPGVADALFDRLLGELNEEGSVPTVAPEVPKKRFRRRILIPAIAALGVLSLVTAALVFLPPDRSALAVIEQARQRFKELPPYHATTRLMANDNSASPDFELVVENKDAYESITKWRTEVTSSTTQEKGNFRVADGQNLGIYEATSNTFHLKPILETDQPEIQSPSYFHNPSFHWWSSGLGPDKPKPSSEFFEEDCESSETKYLGRPAAHLICSASPAPIEIWIDDQTGMMLKGKFFDIVREVTSIDFTPEFEAGTFETKPPAGAFLRWEGKGEPPSGYETKLGESVVATYAGGIYAGQFVAGAKDLWFTSMTTDEGPYTSQIHRMNPRDGTHIAKIAMPERVQVAGMVESGDYLWVLENLQPDDQREAALQRLDLRTNKLIEPIIRLGKSPAGIDFAAGALWATAGEPRSYKVGRAEGEFIPISRVDPESFQVTSFDIGLTPTGALVEQQGSLFISGSRPHPSGESSDSVLVRFDIAEMRVSGEVALDSFPSSPVAGFGSIWLTTSDSKENSIVNRIDAATLETKKIPSGKGSFSITIGGDLLWVSNYHEDAVVKIDPKTDQIIGKVAIGPAPGPIAAGFGSLWVSFGQKDLKIARVLIE